MPQGHSRFHEVFRAARDGCTDRVLQLIDADEALLNVTDSNQNTPLLVALYRKHLELSARLIERRANVFVMNHSDRWAMGLITQRNGLRADDRKRLVETAIAAGVWEAEIFHAVWRRDHQRADAILSNDPAQALIRLAQPDGADGFYNALPYCGLSPLHYAVLAGDLRTVRLLLEAGADADSVPHAHASDSRHTPMMLVPSGCKAIAELLVAHGANVRHSAFYLSSGSKSMREVVVAHGAAGSPLMGALCLGEIEKAVEIARSDPAVIHDRLPGAYIDTPLHMAAQVGCAEVIDLLIGHGMDVDTPNSRGYSALTMAAELYCSFDIFKLLVQHGADIHVGQDAPLHNAVWQHAYGHWDFEKVIRFLVQVGARPRGLYHCALAGNLRAAKLLIELGADVNETRDDTWPGTNSGCTPLDYCSGVAGEQSHPALAEYLRQEGGLHASELGQKP